MADYEHVDRELEHRQDLANQGEQHPWYRLEASPYGPTRGCSKVDCAGGFDP